MPSTLLALYRVVFRRPALVWIGALCLSGLAVHAALGIQLDDDITRLFAHDGPAVRDLKDLETTFGTNETSMAVILHAPGGLDAEVIAAVDRISSRAALLMDVDRVDSITATAFALPDEEEVRITPVFGPESEVSLSLPERIQRLRTVSPMGPRLLSADGTRTLIAVRPLSELRTNADLRELDETLSQLALDEAQASKSSLTVHMAGIPSTRLASMDSMRADLLWLTSITGVAVFLVVLLAYRSLLTTLAILLPGGVAVACTLGLLALLGHQLNPLTAVLPALLIVMSIADGMHLASAYHASPATTPEARAEEAVGVGWLGCTLTTLTTMVGFSSLQLTTPEVLQEFGRMAATGILLAYVSVMLLVPASLVVFRLAPCAPAAAAPPPWLMGVLERSVRPVGRRALIGASLVLLLGAGLMGSRAHLDNYLLDALDERHPVSHGNRQLDRYLGGMMPFEVWLHGEPEIFGQPEVLAKLWQLERYVHETYDVSISLSPASMVSSAYETFAGKTGIPKDTPALIDLWFLLEADDPEALRRVITPEQDRARLTFFAHDGGARYLLELAQGVDRQARALFDPHGVSVRTTGVPVVASEGTNRLSEELLNGLMMTIVAIILCIGLAFRSLSLAVASLVPNLLPITLTVAYFGFTGQYIDPVPAISFTIAIGIAVDDTIHLFSRYAQGRLAGLGAEAASVQAVKKTYRPVAVTTGALVAGFGLLVTSGFPPNRSLGLLVSATLTIALLADIFLTPAWLAWLKPEVDTSRVARSDSEASRAI